MRLQTKQGMLSSAVYLQMHTCVFPFFAVPFDLQWLKSVREAVKCTTLLSLVLCLAFTFVIVQSSGASNLAPPGFGGHQPSFSGRESYEDLPLRSSGSNHLKGLFSQAALRHQPQGRPAAWPYVLSTALRPNLQRMHQSQAFCTA